MFKPRDLLKLLVPRRSYHTSTAIVSVVAQAFFNGIVCRGANATAQYLLAAADLIKVQQ